MTERYAVLIDRPVPGVAYGPVVMVSASDHGNAIGHFQDVGLAKLFTESVREWDRRANLGLGRLRVFDHVASIVVFELNTAQ